MRNGYIRFSLLGIAAMALAACQGNLGSGSGLSIPQTAPYGQPGGPGAPASGTQSRQRTLDGAVYLAPDMTEIPLPTVDGYGVTIALGTPTPTASPTPSVAATASSPANAKPHGLRKRAREIVVAQAAASASPSPAPTASPTASGSASASASPAGATASASAASTSPGAAASPSARPTGSPSAKAAKTVTKTVVFPDAAPAAPSPSPTGNVQTFAARKAIVRGYIQPATALSLYGLGAIRFTIPKAEQTTGRGFTIALFAVGKRHHESVVASDDAPTLRDGAVASSHAEPLALKAGTGYDLVLYGDELAPTPGSVPSGYPSPGNNPFVTPYPSGAPGVPGAPSGAIAPSLTPGAIVPSTSHP